MTYVHATMTIRLVLLTAVMTCAAAGCASEEHLKRADGYYKEGVAVVRVDPQAAFVSFQRAVQENPRHKDAQYYLGHLYAQQGKLEVAEERFREALRIDPEYSEAHTYLGQVLAQRERWDEAIAAYRRALSNPLYVTPDLARFHLGRALAHEGKMEEAIQAYEDALLVSPLSVPEEALRLELGRAYYRLGRDQKAREALGRVVSLDESGQYAVAANELLGRLRP